MDKELMDYVKEKTADLLAAPMCCKELRAAAEAWLAALGTEKEADAAKAYVAEHRPRPWRRTAASRRTRAVPTATARRTPPRRPSSKRKPSSSEPGKSRDAPAFFMPALRKSDGTLTRLR